MYSVNNHSLGQITTVTYLERERGIIEKNMKEGEINILRIFEKKTENIILHANIQICVYVYVGVYACMCVCKA